MTAAFNQFLRALERTERMPLPDLARYQEQLLIRLVRRKSSLNRSPCIRAHSYLRQLLSIGRFSLQDFSVEGFPSVKKKFLDVSSRITAQHARRAPVAGRARPTADPYVSS
jgi:hypothetical protein